MLSLRSMTVRMYWAIVVALLGFSIALAAWYAPVETTMGPIQKVFYLHLPAAVNMFIAAFVVFAAGLRYLWTRDPRWDLLADAAARVTVLFCSVVLLTGMIWAHGAWGHWWTWSPRLTFSLIMLLLYVVYLAIRPTIESPQRRAVVSAVYGLLAFMDVPLVYLSVKLLPDIHPSSVELEPAMKLTLIAWFVPISMLCLGLILARFTLSTMRASLNPSQADGAAPAWANFAGGHR